MPYHPVFNVPRFALRQPRPVLPLHRGDRPAVRPRRDARASSRRCSRERYRPSAALMSTIVNARTLRETARRVVAASRSRLVAVDLVLRCCAASRLPAGHGRPADGTSRCAGERVLRRRRARRGRWSPGTVARGQLRRRTTLVLHAAKVRRRGSRRYVPDAASTRRCSSAGQERYDIFCAPCHGRAGDGDGMIVQRGFTPAAVVPRASGCATSRPATSST